MNREGIENRELTVGHLAGYKSVSESHSTPALGIWMKIPSTNNKLNYQLNQVTYGQTH